MRGFECGVSFGFGGRDDHYYVILWEQPVHRRVAAEVYHWYDMRVCKLPGFYRLERWLHEREERRHGDFAMPLSCKQDCRCYDLQLKQRRQLAYLRIDDREVILPLWPTAPELRRFRM